MIVEETPLAGCFLIRPQVFQDPRGYFFESFNQEKFSQATGVDTPFVQDNVSRSVRGVLRGLHMQLGEHAQAKLVSVSEGEVLDVAVDLRPGSPTFGQQFSVLLSGDNFLRLYIPRGFAHGFAVLSETAVFQYKCDNYYCKAAESGLIYDDPALGIDWQLPQQQVLLSEKDAVLPTLSEWKAQQGL